MSDRFIVIEVDNWDGWQELLNESCPAGYHLVQILGDGGPEKTHHLVYERDHVSEHVWTMLTKWLRRVDRTEP